MKKLAILVSMGIIMASSVSCTANDDAWKNNTGTISLTDKTVSGSGAVFDGSTVKITEGGDFEVTGALENGMIYVNTEDKVKLRLSGVNLTNESGPAIFFDNADKGFITITENTENYLADGAEYTVEAKSALFSNDDLEIKGNGVLYVTSAAKHGIASDDDLTIENGEIHINSYEHGLKANNTVLISGGNITISTEMGKGIKGEESVEINGGTINIEKSDEGIESKGTLVINDGIINIVSTDDGINTGNADTTTEDTVTADTTADNTETVRNERPQGGFGGGRMPQNGEVPAMPQNGEMPELPENGEMPERPQMPQNGEMPEMPQRPQGGMPQGGMGGGFGRLDEETAKAHEVTINGGKIYINSGADGIDSNGNLTINGGELTIAGPLRNDNSSLDADGTISLNGGTVIALSSGGMMQLPENENMQNYVRVMFSETQKSGTVITIKDSDGNEIMNTTPKKDFRALIFSSADLKTGAEYSIYINDTLYESFTAADGANNAGAAGDTGGFGGMGGRPQGNMTGRSENRSQRENRQKVSVKLNGTELQFTENPFIKNGTTLVPFRAILEALGAEVSWEKETKTVTAVKDGTTIVLQIGNKSATVNGESRELTEAPEISNSSTMIPVRFISESLNKTVGWDDTTKTVIIE